MIARRNNEKLLIYVITNMTLLAICVVISTCGPASSVKNAERVAQQVQKFATQTAVVTVTALPPPDEAVISTLSPQAGAIDEQSTPTTQLERSGPFQQMSTEEALIAGRVISLEVDPDGGIWLISEGGISQFDGEFWNGFLTETTGEMVGMDRKGHFWLVSYNGESITSWDRTAWISYTLSTGWEPVKSDGLHVGLGGVTSDIYGNVWLASESGLRMFNGSSWQNIDNEMMGMTPVESPEIISEYKIKTLQDRGEVWVGRCDWSGPGPMNGGGVRIYGRGEWLDNELPFDGGCVTTIEEGINGDIWVGRDGELWKLSGADGRWNQFIPPELLEEIGVRYGYVVGLTIDPDGNPWVEMEICGGASCYNGEILFHLNASDWTQIGEVTTGFRREILFDEHDNPWIISGGSIFHVVGDDLEHLTDLNVLAATSDHAGGVWLLAQGSGAPTLWKLDNK